MNAEMQANLEADFLEPKRKKSARTMGKKRGPYKLRLEAESGEGKLATMIVSEVELQGERYFTTPSGLLIAEECRDMFMSGLSAVKRLRSGERQCLVQHPQINRRLEQLKNHMESGNRIIKCLFNHYSALV